MTQSQQLRKLAAQSATAFLVAALCAFPLYIDKFSNLGVVKFTAVCTLCWAFALWLGALRAVGAVPQPGRLPWRQDTALWALVDASAGIGTSKNKHKRTAKIRFFTYKRITHTNICG